MKELLVKLAVSISVSVLTLAMVVGLCWLLHMLLSPLATQPERFDVWLAVALLLFIVGHRAWRDLSKKD